MIHAGFLTLNKAEKSDQCIGPEFWLRRASLALR
jgi:hypothetical protein